MAFSLHSEKLKSLYNFTICTTAIANKTLQFHGKFSSKVTLNIFLVFADVFFFEFIMRFVVLMVIPYYFTLQILDTGYRT